MPQVSATGLDSVNQGMSCRGEYAGLRVVLEAGVTAAIPQTHSQATKSIATPSIGQEQMNNAVSTNASFDMAPVQHQVMAPVLVNPAFGLTAQGYPLHNPNINNETFQVYEDNNTWNPYYGPVFDAFDVSDHDWTFMVNWAGSP